MQKNSLRCILLGYQLAFILVLGCNVSSKRPQDSEVKIKALRYCLSRIEGKTSDNTEVDYDAMHSLIAGSNLKYIFLDHDIQGKIVSVYWFGEDEKLFAVKLLMDESDSIVVPVDDAYRAENKKYIETGEPQSFTVLLSDEHDAKKVKSVELVWEQD